MKWRIKAAAFFAAIVVISTASYAQFNQALMLSIRGARVDGVCGSANGVSTATAPTANLCSAGIASSVTGSGPWNWTCNGTGGGTTASCSAPTSGGATPAPAAAANFTRLAINTDFTDAAHANINNWLRCEYTSVSGPAIDQAEWYQGWFTVGMGEDCQHNPPPFSQVTDPTYGNKALQLYRDNSFNGSDAPHELAQMESIASDGAHGKAFTNFYAETIMRTSTQSYPLNNNLNTNIWSVGLQGSSSFSVGTGVVEWDGIETWGQAGVNGACVHNGGNDAGCTYDNGPLAGWDATVYHKYAWRVTSTGAGSPPVFCSWVEDTPDVSGLVSKGCINLPSSTSAQNNGQDYSTAIILMSGEGFGCDPKPCSISVPNYTAWVKSIKVWVCQAWTPNQNPLGGAQQCFTSQANP